MKQLSRDQFLMIAAVAFPLIGTAAGRYLPSRSGPSVAAAGIAVMGRPDAPEEEESLSLDFQIPRAPENENNPVVKLYRRAHAEQFGRTPLEKAPKYRPPVVQASQTAPVQTPDQKLVEALAAVKTFELTSIVAGRENLAVIGGRMRHVGDVLKKGWKLVEIDTELNCVILEHEVAGKQKLQIRQRPLKGEPGESGLEIVRRSGGPGPTDSAAPDAPTAPPETPR